MLQIENTQVISKITMFPIAYTKCQLGGDWYENKLEIVFIPDSCYPDYTEIQNWIMKRIDGQELNIEDVVNIIYLFIKGKYEPKNLYIKNTVENCKTHFKVIVEK